jgi:hypothetical protein
MRKLFAIIEGFFIVAAAHRALSWIAPGMLEPRSD